MDKEESNLEDGSADTLQMEVQNKKELIKIKKKKRSSKICRAMSNNVTYV